MPSNSPLPNVRPVRIISRHQHSASEPGGVHIHRHLNRRFWCERESGRTNRIGYRARSGCGMRIAGSLTEGCEGIRWTRWGKTQLGSGEVLLQLATSLKVPSPLDPLLHVVRSGRVGRVRKGLRNILKEAPTQFDDESASVHKFRALGEFRNRYT